MSWLTAFVLTEVLEAPIYLWGQRASDRGWPARVAIALGPSAVTHPVLWFGIRPALEPALGFWGFVVVGELAVIVAEGAYLRELEVPRPWALSVVANVLSAAVGLGLSLSGAL